MSLKFRLNNAIIKIQTFCRQRVDIFFYNRTEQNKKRRHATLSRCHRLHQFIGYMCAWFIHWVRVEFTFQLPNHVSWYCMSLTWFNDVFQWDSRSPVRWKVSGTTWNICNKFSSCVSTRQNVCVYVSSFFGLSATLKIILRQQTSGRHIQTLNV